MRRKTIVVLFETPRGVQFDCIVNIKRVEDKRKLTKTNKSWVRKSNNRNILVEIQGLVHRFLVAFNDMIQYNKFMFNYKCKNEINLREYDFCFV